VAAKFVHSRIVNRHEQTGNIWINNLRKVVDEKMTKPIKNRGEAIQMMRVNI